MPNIYFSALFLYARCTTEAVKDPEWKVTARETSRKRTEYRRSEALYKNLTIPTPTRQKLCPKTEGDKVVRPCGKGHFGSVGPNVRFHIQYLVRRGRKRIGCFTLIHNVLRCVKLPPCQKITALHTATRALVIRGGSH